MKTTVSLGGRDGRRIDEQLELFRQSADQYVRRQDAPIARRRGRLPRRTLNQLRGTDR